MLWLNNFPVKASLSQEVSPRVLVTGNPIDYKKHCRCPLLYFVQTHESSNNTDKPRTIGAICLGPTVNDQGTYIFLNHATGKRIYQVKWTELPTPQYAMDRVHQLADKDKNSIGIIFKNRYQIVFEDLDGIDDGWEDPANNERVYSDDGDAEDSNINTFEDSDYDPSEDTDDGTPTSNKQKTRTKECMRQKYMGTQ